MFERLFTTENTENTEKIKVK